MATVTLGVSTTSTSDGTSYASGSFTPAAGDLLVAFVTASDTTTVTPTMTDSQSLGFTFISSSTFNTSASKIYLFIANAKAAASSMTVTFDCTGDAATGTVIDVLLVSGMTKTGTSASKQTAFQNNQAGGGTPAPAFASAVKTYNVVVGAVGNLSNPAGLTPPATFTEQDDTGYATPTTGAEIVSVNSGFTGTTVTWGSTSATAFGAFILELDTTVSVVTSAGSTWDTTAGNKTVVATPAVGELIVVVHGMSGWAGGDTSVITDNNSDGLGVYTQIGGNPLSNGGGTAGALWISIRNSFIGSASSTTFTVTNVGDTGGGLTVYRVTGMTRTGAAASKQSRGESTQVENPPTITFGASTVGGNPVILGVFGEDNPPAITPPTGFTETLDSGWAVPTSGIEISFISATDAATLYSFTGGALTDHNEVGVELDTSALPAALANMLMMMGFGI